MNPIRELKANEALTQIEQELVRMFTVDRERPQAISKLVRSIEKHGCDGYLAATAKQKAASRRPFSVLAMDVAWFVPGIDWIGSKGGQVCWWRHQGADSANWYRQVLKDYFSDPQAASLLSLPDVFNRPQFVNFTSLGSAKATGRRGPSARAIDALTPATWSGTFDPRRTDRPVGQWKDHFTRYRRIIAEHLTQACPEVRPDATSLAWVYVGPGHPEKKQTPPHWGASLFLLIQSNAPARVRADRSTALNTLLANLLRSLRNSAPAALGNRREKQTVVQVVAHEFKNITQEAAALAQDVKSRTAVLITIPSPDGRSISVDREKLAVLARKADVLNYSVQVSSAFALAANWLFSPKETDSDVVPDPGARHFRHALALTLRLAAATMPHWTLVGVPTESEIRAHFAAAGARADRLENLAGNFAISVMIFFCLEAVRNLKQNLGQEPVRVEIGGHDNTVLLQATAAGPPPTASEVSFSVTALIEEVRLHCPWSLIDIDPIVRIGTGARLSPDTVEVRRVTQFTVHNILSLHYDPRPTKPKA